MKKKHFSGFPARMEFTPVPNFFLTELMPKIEDIAELKVTLHIFWLFYQKRGYPRLVTQDELISASPLGSEIKEEMIRHALDLAIERGTILRLTLDRDGKTEDIYFLNTEKERKTVDKIQRGELSLRELTLRRETPISIAQPPNIFSLYEQNVGMLTPMIAEELREAEKLYPPQWIESAFREAVALNKRNWRYIARILERWTTEGKDDGKPRRYSKKETDPNKYIRGKYGHLVKR
jgi:DnaD/phage-associated family protein